MSEVQETKELSAEFWASQNFESASDTIPLNGLMSNDEMSARGINEGIWMRACAIILQDDDEQLYAKFKDDESAEVFLDMMENLTEFIESQRAGIEIFEACKLRLLVCLSRYEAAMDDGGAS